MVKERVQNGEKYVFLMNFATTARVIQGIELAGYETKILRSQI